MPGSTNPVLKHLGYAEDARLIIFHADDVGMCHGSNRALMDLTRAGMVHTGSVMAPCPWAPEILAYAHKEPELDLGVHLTLNSEWPKYRWGPVSTRDPASGLVDETGCFWPNPETTEKNLVVEAAVTELRAQIELVRHAGVDFTHIDTHMGAALLPGLFEAYVRLGFEYKVPVLLVRRFDEYTRGMNIGSMDTPEWARFVASVEARGMPLVDTFRITPGYHIDDAEGGRAALYERILHELPAGITYFSLHPNAPGDIETIDPEHAFWRTFEYQYFQSNRLRQFLAEEEIVTIGYRVLCEFMRG
jgi:predicted glycoside hydrolase/deacetylase ChbG (UPF0249 family)